jgi:hypothetical protein
VPFIELPMPNEHAVKMTTSSGAVTQASSRRSIRRRTT